MFSTYLRKMRKICFIIINLTPFLFLLETAFASYTSNEALLRMKQFAKSGKIPTYVIEQGIYRYIEGYSTVRVTGKNVFMRSQPQKRARIITKLSNIKLDYLGEWTHPKNGEKWICVKRKTSDEIGWIYGQYTELLKETITKSKITQAASKEDDKVHRKDKDCTEDPCGALGGLLFISPILYLFAKYEEKKQLSGKTEPAWDFSFANTDVKEKCCPHYNRTSCGGCWELSGEHPFSNILYSKCNYFGKYVHTSRTPQYNAKNLESFENECCPFHNKYHCEGCPRMDSNDEYYGSYKCRHFNAYVQPDESPQYNSEHLKYR